jgi:hypothetical protein
MSDLVELRLARIFSTLRHDVEAFRDHLLEDSAKVLRREEEASIRERWYRTGATLASLRERFFDTGDKVRTYELTPTATNRGAPYPLFGEYGTGRKGSETGRPAPRGYRYGRRSGMTARRYSRIAVETAAPEIHRLAVEQSRRFAANMTT